MNKKIAPSAPSTATEIATKNFVFDPEIIRRFDVNGPRYTSYPTADRFTEQFTANEAQSWLAKRREEVRPKPLSLYFHIPFCNTICYYCACNKIITKDHSLSSRYISYVAKELAMQKKFLSADEEPLDAVQLHWGGGTPTFLSHAEMRTFMGEIRRHFRLLDGGEYSIEVDPRKVDAETVALLGELGFNRMSVGIQDFDEKVQRAVNRVQSEDETRLVIDAARSNGFHSISVDLIYGLPFQSVEGFGRTLDRVLAMAPNRFSIYNYAHLPTLFMPQRRIAEDDLPHPETKLEILALAIRKLTDAGYEFIGMDHFARPDDELTLAQQAGRLHRNFQGYSTHADCDMLSFGISSISKVGASYYQNAKNEEGYYAALDAGQLPVVRGLELNDDDLLRRAIIQDLMCHFSLSFPAIEEKYHLVFKDYFAEELKSLAAMQDQGLVSLDEHSVTVTARGRMLVRVIAMAFDRYLREKRNQARPAKYSKVI